MSRESDWEEAARALNPSPERLKLMRHEFHARLAFERRQEADISAFTVQKRRLAAAVMRAMAALTRAQAAERAYLATCRHPASRINGGDPGETRGGGSNNPPYCTLCGQKL